METVVLVFERQKLTFHDLENLVEERSWLSENKKCLIIGDSDDRHLFIVRVAESDAEGIFEDWPHSMIPIGDYSVFAVDYRSREFATRVVREMAVTVDMLVDTNYGEIVRGSQLSAEHLVPR